jgi:deazaflavin-dependent oxidoreductase (nitroreductase family)
MPAVAFASDARVQGGALSSAGCEAITGAYDHAVALACQSSGCGTPAAHSRTDDGQPLALVPPVAVLAGNEPGLGPACTIMPEANDWNSKIIEEFRANGGKVGGGFEGAPLLLLHTTGAKSGRERVSPVMYQAVGDSYAVFASKGGAPSNPDWFYNLLANPQVRAEIGRQTVELTGRVAEGDDRDRIWSAQKRAYPGFADYERKTTRQIPVVILDPVR